MNFASFAWFLLEQNNLFTVSASAGSGPSVLVVNLQHIRRAKCFTSGLWKTHQQTLLSCDGPTAPESAGPSLTVKAAVVLFSLVGVSLRNTPAAHQLVTLLVFAPPSLNIHSRAPRTGPPLPHLDKALTQGFSDAACTTCDHTVRPLQPRSCRGASFSSGAESHRVCYHHK